MVRNKFGITNIGGYAYRDIAGTTTLSDHAKGLALDVMTSNGQGIADWARSNAKTLNITYVIYNRRIWSVARSGEGWRRYTGVNPHTDHVHLSFKPSGASPTASGSASGGSGTADTAPKLKAGFDVGGAIDAIGDANPLSGIGVLTNSPADTVGAIKETVDKLGDFIKFLEFLQDKHNWFRIGMFLLGAGMLFIAFRALSKTGNANPGEVLAP